MGDLTDRRRNSTHHGGFGTRAIKAATTPPRVDQVANSVPIYQSVTFVANT